MSEQDNTNVVTTPSTSEPQMVPKERLDELIQDRRRLEEQLSVTTHLLRSAVPQQHVQQQEHPDMVRLKEENPVVYATIKAQEEKLKQMSAAQFATVDNLDRTQFIQTFGEKGLKYSQKVEQELQRQRQQGNFYDRAQIYTHILGVESIQAGNQPKVVQAATPPKVNSDVPSQDPKVAGTIASGSAAGTSVRKTIEEMEKDLENYQF